MRGGSMKEKNTDGCKISSSAYKKCVCGHWDWEHGGKPNDECTHAVKHRSKKQWPGTRYCECKKFMEAT